MTIKSLFETLFKQAPTPADYLQFQKAQEVLNSKAAELQASADAFGKMVRSMQNGGPSPRVRRSAKSGGRSS